MKDEIKILTPNGILGYGIPKDDFQRGLDARPDAIIVDGGSTDPGPYLLGLGATIVSKAAYRRDLSIMLAACAAHKIPVLISSAGGPGIAQHVDDMVDMVREIAAEENYRFKVAAIYSDIDKQQVHDALDAGVVRECGSSGVLTPADVDRSAHIVAQIGAEPFYEVLKAHPDVDVIVSGRAYDPAPFAGFCMLHGIDPGIYWHMGKIVECGANCAEPKGKVILATVRRDSFDLEPMNPGERCTVASVAAHTLYEKSRPDVLHGPGGVLDLRESTYEQLNARTVRVRGSRFTPDSPYTVKLEGAGIVGYRTTFIGGVRDPVLIGQIDDFLARVHAQEVETYPSVRSGQASVHFHVYGKNGVMAGWEPNTCAMPHEIGILGEVTAPTQDEANAICSSTRINVLHMSYPGQVATAGNLALPLNPPENPIGPVCRFLVYHIMDIDSPTALFPVRIEEV